jgi:hypothetical protein
MLIVEENRGRISIIEKPITGGGQPEARSFEIVRYGSN